MSPADAPTANNGSGQLLLEIVTPDGRQYLGPVRFVELPSDTGDLGIYPGHAPVFVGLSGGEIRAYSAEGIKIFFVAGGYVRIGPDSVRVLALFAAKEENAQIEEACRRAKDAMELVGEEPEQQIEDELALLRIKLEQAKRTAKTAKLRVEG
ncbi:MAG: F0F1 ATP synthase subunit epsilon [Verrucomicrobiota bacterium]